MIILYSLVVFVLIFFLINLIKQNNSIEGHFSTALIFTIGCFIFYYAVPIELLLSSNKTLNVGKIQVSFTTELSYLIIINGLLANIAFIIGYNNSKLSKFFRLLNLERFDEKTSGKQIEKRSFLRFNKMTFSAIIIFFLILVLFGDIVIAIKGNYWENVYFSYSNPLYSFLLYLLLIIICVESASSFLEREKILVPVFFLSLIIFWGFYSSDKNPILLAAFGLSAIFYRKKFKNPIYFYFVTIIIIFGVFGFTTFFSAFRSGITLNLELLVNAILDRGIFVHSDPTGPMISIHKTLTNSFDLSYGITYIESFFLLIPKFLWSSRPLDLASQFAIENMTNWKPGYGMGFSLLAESILNFNIIIGPIVQYFFLGFLWGWLWEKVRRLMLNVKGSFFLSLYLVLGNYTLIVMHRLAFSGIIKQLLVYMIIIIAIQKIGFSYREKVFLKRSRN